MKGRWVTDDEITSVPGKLGYFRLLAPLLYRDNHGDFWKTPAGTISNLSSFPWYVRTFLPSTVLVKAPFMHDHFYDKQPIDPHTGKPITRRRSDQLYRDGAIAEGMNERLAKRLYAGLKVGGRLQWRKYRRLDKKMKRAARK